MYENDLAWAAGFMDGDSSFTISLIGGYFTPQILATNKDARPVVRLKEILGGRVSTYTSKPGRDFSPRPTIMYDWRSTNKATFDICVKLLPYLVLKRNQAECIIELGKLRRQGGRITQEVRLLQAILYNTCSELNHTFIGLAAETEREGLRESEVSNSPNCRDDKPTEDAEMPSHLSKELRS